MTAPFTYKNSPLQPPQHILIWWQCRTSGDCLHNSPPWPSLAVSLTPQLHKPGDSARKGAPVTSQRPRLLIIILAFRISTYDFEGEHGLSVHPLQAFMGKVNISSLWLHLDPLL